jgi:hypothetical protein
VVVAAGGLLCFRLFVCDCCQRFHSAIDACVKKIDDTCMEKRSLSAGRWLPVLYFSVKAYKAWNKKRVLPSHFEKY